MCSSSRAMPTPWATPPCTIPSTIAGWSRTPQSSAIAYSRISTWPVFRSTSTMTTCAAFEAVRSKLPRPSASAGAAPKAPHGPGGDAGWVPPPPRGGGALGDDFPAGADAPRRALGDRSAEGGFGAEECKHPQGAGADLAAGVHADPDEP